MSWLLVNVSTRNQWYSKKKGEIVRKWEQRVAQSLKKMASYVCSLKYAVWCGLRCE